MVVLSPEVRQQWGEAGRLATLSLARLLFAAGWITAKALRVLATFVAGVLFGVGWLAGAAAWPALCWCARAVRLGWEQGRKPIGGQRGPA